MAHFEISDTQSTLVLKELRCSIVLKTVAKNQIYLAGALEKARHRRLFLKSRYFFCSYTTYVKSMCNPIVQTKEAHIKLYQSRSCKREGSPL